MFPRCQTKGLNFSRKKDMIVLHAKILPENNRRLEAEGITAVPQLTAV